MGCICAKFQDDGVCLDMGCSCWKGAKIRDEDVELGVINANAPNQQNAGNAQNAQNQQDAANAQNAQNQQNAANAQHEDREFPLQEIRRMTDNFIPERHIREGGFGQYFCGILETTGQMVAIKRFNNNDLRYEFAVQVVTYKRLHHQNIMAMIGYCKIEEPAIVFEDMPRLDIHLHGLGPATQPLDWNARIRIAAGVANGLYHLHTVSRLRPIICWDLRSSNILLGEGFEPKLTDFGLQRFEPPQVRPQNRTADLAYRPPEYLADETLTILSDVYSFGVVLLEIITGQEAYSETRGDGNEFLVNWVRSRSVGENFNNDLVDPQLGGRFPEAMLNFVGNLALRCVLEDSGLRPSMRAVVDAMASVAARRYDHNADQGGQGSRVLEVGESSRAREGKTSADPGGPTTD